MLSRRHILRRRPLGSISTKSYKKGTYFVKMAKLQKLRPGAPQPGGLGPAAPLPGDRPQGPVCNFFLLFFAFKPLPPGCRAARFRPPGSGAAGVYFCKFPNRKYIFVKNENKKYKNKKPLGSALSVKSTDSFLFYHKKTAWNHQTQVEPSKQWTT